MPGAPVACKVTSSESCVRGKSASFVRHVCIDVSGTPLEGNFRAGQSFGVIPLGVDGSGRPHKVRLYSIACPSWGEDGAGKIVSTTPKRLIDERRAQSSGNVSEDHSLFVGVCSNYLCGLNVGDSVQLSGPAGKRFVLPSDPAEHDYLFLATGTGIAPFRGMLMELLEGPQSGAARSSLLRSPDSIAGVTAAQWRGPCQSRIHLVMGVAYSTDLLYDSFFRELAGKHPNFSYHTVISREVPPSKGYGPYVHNYLEARLDEFAPFLSSSRSIIYICGLAGMQVGVFKLLAENSLGEQYLSIHESLAGRAPADWTTEEIKRRVHATHRCTIEVY